MRARYCTTSPQQMKQLIWIFAILQAKRLYYIIIDLSGEKTVAPAVGAWIESTALGGNKTHIKNQTGSIGRNLETVSSLC